MNSYFFNGIMRTHKNVIIEEYYKVKRILNRRPMRVDMLTYMDNNIYNTMKKRPKSNIFKNYLKFLKQIDEMSEKEKEFENTFASDFINMIECTFMTKTYKMPLMLAFYNDGDMKLEINEEDIYLSFKQFYSNEENKVDMLRHKNTSEFESWGKDEYVKLAETNPIKFLLQTESKFFYKQGGYFCISEKIEPYIKNKAFLCNFKDAVEFRVKEYLINRMNNK